MATCGTGDAVDYFGAFGQLDKLFSQGIDGILSDIATAILKAAVGLFADIATDIPTLADASVNSKIGLQINWLVILLAVASLLFAAARMALERRGQAGATAVKGIVRMILVAGAATYVLNQLATLADNYTRHLYESGVKEQLKTIAACGTDSLTAFLLIIIGILLIIAGIIHIILLYIRLGVMVVLSGTLPLAAAASMTEWGTGWWRKHLAWMVAWLVFKPATGLVLYAGAVMINSTGASASQQKIAGCGVLLLSAVALPALLRLIVPAAAALGSSDGALGAASGAAAGAAAATGAVMAPAWGRATRSVRGQSGPSGASGAAGSAGSSGRRSLGRAAAGLGVAAVEKTARGAGRATSTAARNLGNVASSALPGVHDDNQH
ncbi:hypothetical protein [Plantactinospora sp. KBS50]|uniref:hypothetical protein n=1 Tax=Plantactinospora sp. KBS50 TaxID=2024580 RepID=UPI000BAAC011|nr:hypothetical protein [Plantactinospora sp. KBS50]ASW53429.1 hypothetical protein CIK06_03375 [Plantactinospora sp. KBS50]